MTMVSDFREAERLGDRGDEGASSRSALDAHLARIADPRGQGAATFRSVHATTAMAEAEAADLRRRAGLRPLSPLDGVTVSIKDLFDVAGEVTTAGSKVLAGRAPAKRDARIVGRLRRAGAVIIGKTNMSEFAYTAVGLNPHHGTPLNPWDRGTGRIPGGSSSGAAVSVTDRMCAMAVGTDTGGSVRIPAALCGLVGFKPTARRVSLDGCFPLSSELDSIGGLARTVEDCIALDRVLAGIEPEEPLPQPRRAETITLFVPTNHLFDGADPAVLAAFDQSLSDMVDARVRIISGALPALNIMHEIASSGGFAAAEAWATLGPLVSLKDEECDPFVVTRIRRGAAISAADWQHMVGLRRRLIDELWTASGDVTAIASPTCAILAPSLAELEGDAHRRLAVNLKLLRNTSFANYVDGCSITIPCGEAGGPGIGLMLTARHGQDDGLLSTALTIQSILMRGLRTE